MKTDEIEILRGGLRSLAEQPYHPGRTDIEQARTRGRRTLLRRRITTAGASALAVATFVAVAASLTPRAPGSVAGETGPPGKRPNPLVQSATFTWLPPGFKVTYFQWQDEGGFSQTATDGRGSQYVLTIYLEDPDSPESTADPTVSRVAAPPVHGRPARWVKGVNKGDHMTLTRLEFQPVAGRWAKVDESVPGLGNKSTLHRVAEGVRPSNKPTAFPLQITNIPQKVLDGHNNAYGFSPASDRLPKWGATLEFDEGSLGIHVARHGDPIPRTIAPNTTVDGHPAYFVLTEGEPAPGPTPQAPPLPKERIQRLCVYGVNGLDICFTLSGNDVKVPALMALYRHTTLLGTDPARWTLHPLG